MEAAPLTFDAMAIPDFVAGFIYGMTGDNNLAEIETCMESGENIYSEITKAFTDIENGDYIQGIMQIGYLITEFPSELSQCQNMDKDINAIEQWATIFTEPVQLAETVAKNFFLHNAEIVQDISFCEGDWDEGRYFDSGNDFAAMLTAAVGPIQDYYLLGGGLGLEGNLPSLHDILVAAEGFNYRLLMLNDLLDLKECVDLTDQMAYQVY